MGFFKKKQPAAPSGPVYGPVEYVICGLGNPGSKYGNTRHNIGFCALDVLAKDCGAAVERSRFHAMTGEAMLDGRHVLLMKPATYMNLSGQAVQEAMQFYKLPPERLIVLSDDISLPVGKMRIRTKGSAGGHNGLKDIISKLGNNPNFHRLRIGIGHPGDKNKVVGFVLGKPQASEQKLIDEAVDEAARCTEIWLKDGLTKATNRLHAFKAQ